MKPQHQLELFNGRHRDQLWPRLKAGALCTRCDRAASSLVRSGKGFAPRCNWHSGERLPPELLRSAKRRT